MKVSRLFVTPMDCSLPGFSVCGILQARILEWVAVPFSRIFLTQGSNPYLLHCRFFTIWATREAPKCLLNTKETWPDGSSFSNILKTCITTPCCALRGALWYQQFKVKGRIVYKILPDFLLSFFLDLWNLVNICNHVITLTGASWNLQEGSCKWEVLTFKVYIFTLNLSIAWIKSVDNVL